MTQNMIPKIRFLRGLPGWDENFQNLVLMFALLLTVIIHLQDKEFLQAKMC